MDRPVVACVLAGGTGTRLYPASRSDRPKQFLALAGERSLLERTVERVGFADERYVLTREPLVEGVRERAPEAGLLVEPVPKDTGPAMVYAAWQLRERVGDCVLVSAPSDHHVGDDAAFASALEDAARAAVDTGGLVTLGIEPTRPATGYGYVVPAEDRDTNVDSGGSANADSAGRSSADAGGDVRPVAAFHEKPDRDVAAALCERGAYWNAGIFAWTPDALLRAARDSALVPLVDALEDGDPEAGFAAVDPVSVDYAIMERTDEAFVRQLSVAWDDLGDWDALGRVLEGDAADTVAVGDTEVLSIDAAGNVVAAPDDHVSLVGVDDLVVAAWDDRVLVAPRSEAQRVREVATRLREDGRF